VARYGDQLPTDDLLWAVATVAEPAVTTARLAHPPGTCDDSQAVIDLLPAFGPDERFTEGLLGESGVDYQVVLAGAIAVIPPPAAATTTTTAPS